MPNPLITLAGSTLVSAGVSVNSANKATKGANASAAASLAFDQKRYDDWKSIYGPIEQNLSTYYNQLTPAYYETRGIEAFNKEKEQALTTIREHYAQVGIRPDSGLAVGAETALALTAAVTKADIRATSEQKVAEAKQSFLTAGASRDPSNQLSSNLSQRATNDANSANSANQAAGKAIGTAINATGTALADYFKPGLDASEQGGVVA